MWKTLEIISIILLSTSIGLQLGFLKYDPEVYTAWILWVNPFALVLMSILLWNEK